MRRAIVTGITGHLGLELAIQLVAADYTVHGLTRRSGTLPSRLKKRVQLHSLSDNTDTGALNAIFCDVQPSVVFHLAALARREHTSEDVTPFIQANILFGTQILEAMKSSNCTHLVTAGSYLQHFDTDGYRPFNLYAATKQAFEDILTYYVDAIGFTAISLTLADIYSEHDVRSKLMTDIAKSARTGATLILHAQEAWIDPIHVRDAAAAFIHAAALFESEVAPKGTLARYSVSSGRTVSATDLINLFEKFGQRKLDVQRGGSKLGRHIKPWRGVSLPGWAPAITLSEGIERMLVPTAQRPNTLDRRPDEGLTRA